MSRGLSLRRLLAVGALSLTWCGLWSDLSLSNVLVGAAIGFVVSSPSIGLAGAGRINVAPLMRLIGLIFVDLVLSTIAVAREVLTPGDSTDETVIGVRLPPETRDHLLFLTVAVTVTPGTAVVEADPNTPAIYLHLLHRDRTEETVRHVNELARLVNASFPQPRIEVPS